MHFLTIQQMSQKKRQKENITKSPEYRANVNYSWGKNNKKYNEYSGEKTL